MSPRRKLVKNSAVSWFFITVAAFAPAAARADFYYHFWENAHVPAGHLRLTPEAKLFTTTQNFDVNGNAVAITGLTSYTRLMSDVSAQYALSADWTAFARLSWTSIQLEHTSGGFSNSGLQDQSLGLNWRALKSRSGIAVDLQLQMDLPAYANKTATTAGVPLIGDGTMDFTGGAFLTVPLDGGESPEWLLSGGAGFTYRTADFSQSIPWSVSVAYEPERAGFRFSASVLGTTSLGSDIHLASESGTGNVGGTYTANAINPSLVYGRGKIGYRFNERIAVAGGFAIPLFGADAPKGSLMTLALEVAWGPRAKGKGSELTPEQYGRSNQGFVNYAFEARVLKVNDRLNMFKIDKGRQQGVEQGQTFDVFAVNKDGTISEAVARAKATSVKPDEAVLKVTEYFKEVWIEEGFVVKKPLE